MSLTDIKADILNILCKNLECSQPQPVESVALAAEMGVKLPELKRVLERMHGLGVIEADPHLQFNLITREGLLWLDGYGAGYDRKNLQKLIESKYKISIE